MTHNSEDAVSPVVSVILVVAITVLLSATIGAFVLDLGPRTTDTRQQSELGVRTTTNSDATTTVQVVTGGADELRINVNGETVETLENPSAGDTTTIETKEGDSLSVVSVTNGKTSVVSSKSSSSTSPTEGDTTTTLVSYSESFESDTSDWAIYDNGFNYHSFSTSTDYVTDGNQSVYATANAATNFVTVNESAAPITINESTEFNLTADIHYHEYVDLSSFSIGMRPHAAERTTVHNSSIHYNFHDRSGTSGLRIYENDALQVEQTGVYLPNPGDSFSLRLHQDGSTFSVYINKELQGQATYEFKNTHEMDVFLYIGEIKVYVDNLNVETTG